MDRTDILQSAKVAYTRCAYALGRTLSRLHVLGETPPSREHQLRHWAYSLTKVHDSLALAKLDVPWWTYRAIDVVEWWLRARQQPVRAFEYGSGAGTIWLARRIQQVHTVEHHPSFAAQLRPAFDTYPNVDSRLVPPVPARCPQVPSAKEGYRGQDFTQYVATIDAVGGEFDLVVIDGRAREACLVAAVPHLRPGALIVFDNTLRARYRRAIAASDLIARHYRGLTPTLPYPDQTSLLVKSRAGA